MRFRKRRQEAEDAAEPADAVSSEPPPVEAPVMSWTATDPLEPPTAPPPPVRPEPEPEPEPVVEGVAVELPDEPSSSAIADRIFDTTAPAIAEQPISAAPAPEPAPSVTALGDSAEAYASGHGPAPGPMWPGQLEQIARERPEYVVGAAFVGGLLAAMILRRLGS